MEAEPTSHCKIKGRVKSKSVAKKSLGGGPSTHKDAGLKHGTQQCLYMLPCTAPLERTMLKKGNLRLTSTMTLKHMWKLQKSNGQKMQRRGPVKTVDTKYDGQHDFHNCLNVGMYSWMRPSTHKRMHPNWFRIHAISKQTCSKRTWFDFLHATIPIQLYGKRPQNKIA